MEDENEFSGVVGHQYAPGHEPDPYLALLQDIMQWAMSFWGAIAIVLGTLGVLAVFILFRILLSKLKEKKVSKRPQTDAAERFRELRKTRQS
jgi:hypothetical protein